MVSLVVWFNPNYFRVDTLLQQTTVPEWESRYFALMLLFGGFKMVRPFRVGYGKPG
jgi:hypothetical protein